LYDRFSPLYWVTWGLTEDDTHQKYLQKFLERVEPGVILSAGCGAGRYDGILLEAGHSVVGIDQSTGMLARAREHFHSEGLNAEFHHQSAQALAPKLPQFDLVLCHAVVEWLADPLPTLQIIADRVKPGGHLSLLFYNRNAMVYSNALKGRWRWRNLLNDSFLGKGEKLTPPNPQYPHEMIERLEQWGFSATNLSRDT